MFFKILAQERYTRYNPLRSIMSLCTCSWNIYCFNICRIVKYACALRSCSPILTCNSTSEPWKLKTGFMLVHILATYHSGRRRSRMRQGQGLSVSEVTSELGPMQHEFCFTSMGALVSTVVFHSTVVVWKLFSWHCPFKCLLLQHLSYCKVCIRSCSALYYNLFI